MCGLYSWFGDLLVISHNFFGQALVYENLVSLVFTCYYSSHSMLVLRVECVSVARCV